MRSGAKTQLLSLHTAIWYKNTCNKMYPMCADWTTKKGEQKVSIENTLAGKFHLNGCVWIPTIVCSHTHVSAKAREKDRKRGRGETMTVPVPMFRRVKKTEWYLRRGSYNENVNEQNGKQEREKKNQSTWNVFIHLCQVNEHGIPVRCFHLFASSNRKLILYHQHRVPSTMALWHSLALCV